MNSHRLVADLYASAKQWSLPELGAEEIRNQAPEGWTVDIVSAATVSDGDGGQPASEAALSAIADAEAYFGFGVSRDLFLAATKLKWIHSAAAGVGSLLFDEMLRSEVIVTNSAGIHAVPIAEYVVGGILYLLRSFDVAIDQQRNRVWNKDPFVGAGSRMREMGDCRVVIVGAGGLGGAVAERLAALGARCVGVRRNPKKGVPPGFDRVEAAGALAELATGCDVLVITAPDTKETRELVTADILDRLSPGAIVVNVSRGSLLDEEALAARLATGRLRGAVLDVFSEEPLPSESPLWTLPGVLLTPHVSGVTRSGFWRRELALFFDNWHRYASGRPLRNVVDKTAGY
ncbi:MAG: D-2-hydroxyacid dehydrogenase [Anaerolineae bacterium]|nr:D-2-hydroxyacid dehydrogenase [Gemmatimonadaceae bacterium]